MDVNLVISLNHNELVVYLNNLDMDTINMLREDPTQLINFIYEDNLDTYLTIVDELDIDVNKSIIDDETNPINYYISSERNGINWSLLLSRGYKFSKDTLLLMVLEDKVEAFDYTINNILLPCDMLRHTIQQYIIRDYMDDWTANLFNDNKPKLVSVEEFVHFDIPSLSDGDPNNIDSFDHNLTNIEADNTMHYSTPTNKNYKNTLIDMWLADCFVKGTKKA